MSPTIKLEQSFVVGFKTLCRCESQFIQSIPRFECLVGLRVAHRIVGRPPETCRPSEVTGHCYQSCRTWALTKSSPSMARVTGCGIRKRRTARVPKIQNQLPARRDPPGSAARKKSKSEAENPSPVADASCESQRLQRLFNIIPRLVSTCR